MNHGALFQRSNDSLVVWMFIAFFITLTLLASLPAWISGRKKAQFNFFDFTIPLFFPFISVITSLSGCFGLCVFQKATANLFFEPLLDCLICAIYPWAKIHFNSKRTIISSTFTAYFLLLLIIFFIAIFLPAIPAASFGGTEF
jgi:hypothetical protein